MKTLSQAPSAAHQSCLDEALRQSVTLGERWCSKLSNALNQRLTDELDPIQKRQLEHAVAALGKSRGLLELGFPGELREAIAREVSGTASVTAADAGYPASSFDGMEVMKEEQVALEVESFRMQQRVARACKAGFSGFSTCLNTAQGFATAPKAMALRPEVFAGALLKLVQGLDVISPTRTCWLETGAPILGAELTALYVSLAHFLVSLAPAAAPAAGSDGGRQNADAQNERPAPLADPLSAASSARKPANISKKFESPQTQEGNGPELDNLHRLLVGERDSAVEGVSLLAHAAPDEVARHEFSHTLPVALYVLAELEAQDTGKKKTPMPRLASSESMLQMRAYLKKTAQSLGQSLAIEVVGVMIEQIANDSRLLLPVRQVVANSEPAYLRLAVTDPRFFSEKAHPARRLLDAITSSSMSFASETAEGFPAFMESLRQVSLQLTEYQDCDAQHFARLLENFERAQDLHLPEHRQSQQRAEDALLQAELRNLVAVKIAAEIRQRHDFVGVKPVISAFLTGPWAQVLANDRRLGERAVSDDQASAISQALGDVLWCVTADRDSTHRQWLVELIPELIKSLRQGLLSIDYPLAQAQAFFDEMQACHQRALGNTGEAPPAASVPPIIATDMFVTDDDDQDSIQPWIAPTEVQDSGFMQDGDFADAANQPFERLPESQSAAVAPSSDLPALSQSTDLRLGAWIELLVDARWLRAQLTWVSPGYSLFIFTSKGGRQHSMTVRILHHLMEKKFAKIISEQGVLDSALSNVALAALRNKVASP